MLLDAALPACKSWATPLCLHRLHCWHRRHAHGLCLRARPITAERRGQRPVKESPSKRTPHSSGSHGSPSSSHTESSSLCEARSGARLFLRLVVARGISSANLKCQSSADDMMSKNLGLIEWMLNRSRQADIPEGAPQLRNSATSRLWRSRSATSTGCRVRRRRRGTDENKACSPTECRSISTSHSTAGA